MKGDDEVCRRAGMDDYLTKPVDVERLRDTLARFALVRPLATGTTV
jgi:CheY-like chemotaxis protein